MIHTAINVVFVILLKDLNRKYWLGIFMEDDALFGAENIKYIGLISYFIIAWL
jgi:hypothetical protein